MAGAKKLFADRERSLVVLQRFPVLALSVEDGPEEVQARRGLDAPRPAELFLQSQRLPGQGLGFRKG